MSYKTRKENLAQENWLMVLIKYKLYVGVKTPDLNTYNDYRLSTMI